VNTIRIAFALSYPLTPASRGTGGDEVYRRSLGAGALFAVCALLLSCGGSGPRLGALHLGGVDVIYAVRRVAGEAGVPVLVDEVFPKDAFGDLDFRRVELDFEGGTLEAALTQLRESSSGWSFELEDRVLYVRSDQVAKVLPQLDEPSVGGGSLEADLPGVIQWFMHRGVPAYLVPQSQAGVEAPKVKLELPERSSAIRVLRDWVAASGVGLRVRRAGYLQRIDEERIAIVGSTVTPWSALTEPRYLPPGRGPQTSVRALAQIELRTKTPICALDQSVLGDPRGSLDQDGVIDPNQPLEESLDLLGNDQTGRPSKFLWRRDGALVTVMARSFASFAQRDLLAHEKLRAGKVRGTLVDLAEWINANRIEPSQRVLMMGENPGTLPVAEIEIAEGSTVLAALLDFARASGAGWYYSVYDDDSRVFDMVPAPHSWKGAHILALAPWAPEPDPKLN
jgi:hypothetical protein